MIKTKSKANASLKIRLPTNLNYLKSPKRLEGINLNLNEALYELRYGNEN